MYIGEVVAPVLIILGIFTRPAALIYALTLLVATLLVGTGKFFTLTEVGAWGLENEMLYFMGGIVIMLLGAGTIFCINQNIHEINVFVRARIAPP